MAMRDRQKKIDRNRVQGMEKILHSARRDAFAQATRQGYVWILELTFFASAKASRHSVYLSYETEQEALAGMRKQDRKARLFRTEEFAQHYNL
jgi:hypothetical protein